MSQIRKTFPQESIPAEIKKSQKTNRSSFQARKTPEFLQGTPASKCVSLKEKFDNYITDKYNDFTIEQKQLLWKKTSQLLLTQPTNDIITIIETIIQF